MTRDCTRNAGYVSTSDVSEDVYVMGAIVVTMTEDGRFGTHFVSEDMTEMPDVETQLDLGSTVAAAWAAASTAEADASA